MTMNFEFLHDSSTSVTYWLPYNLSHYIHDPLHSMCVFSYSMSASWTPLHKTYYKRQNSYTIVAIYVKTTNMRKCYQIYKSFASSWSSLVMFLCHMLKFVAMNFIQMDKSTANCIFTSSASVNMILELDYTLFHSHDIVMWALAGAMTYCRIIYLGISKPSCFDACLISSMYRITS